MSPSGMQAPFGALNGSTTAVAYFSAQGERRGLAEVRERLGALPVLPVLRLRLLLAIFVGGRSDVGYESRKVGC